jgi:hypothetical protein
MHGNCVKHFRFRHETQLSSDSGLLRRPSAIIGRPVDNQTVHAASVSTTPWGLAPELHSAGDSSVPTLRLRNQIDLFSLAPRPVQLAEPKLGLVGGPRHAKAAAHAGHLAFGIIFDAVGSA